MEDSCDNIENIRKRLEQMEEDGGPYNQEELKKLSNSLSKIAKEVHSEGLFSKNEDFSEIKTEDIKFLLVPYYQADVIQKFMDNRESKLDLALKFYDEFFKILDNYNYFPKDKKELFNILRKKKQDEYGDEKKEGKKPSFELLSQNRDQKIQAYKYKKALSDKIKKMEKEKDFENREYFVAYLELCVLNMFEFIKTISMEIESIAFLSKERKDPNYEVNRKKELEELKKNKMEVVKLTSAEDINKMNPNSKVLKDLKVMNTSTNPNCFDCIPGLKHQNDGNNVVQGYDTAQVNGSHAHTCTVLNDQIHNKLNIREQVFRPTNLPTLTLAEFADREKARMEEQELKAQEAQLNADDEDSDNEEAANRKTYKAREWDDWKDLVDKGSGNTKR